MFVSDHARRRFQDPQYQTQHRTFSASALAKDHEPIAAEDLKIDTIKNSLISETQNNVVDMNQRRLTHPVIFVTIMLNSVSNPITVVIEKTTLSVVALPTPSAPPVTVNP